MLCASHVLRGQVCSNQSKKWRIELLLVKASQDQQNNSVKHLETSFSLVKLYDFKLYVYFEWSSTIPLKNVV